MTPTSASAWAALAAFLPLAPLYAQSAPEGNGCTHAPGPVAVGNAQWNGWGRDIENSRYQPEPALRATDVPKLKLKWSYGYRGAGAYSQPSVVDGRLFVSSSAGRIYALDAATGCTYWTFDAAAPTHTAISVGEFGTAHQMPQPKASKRKHVRIDAHIDVQKAPSGVFFGDDNGAVYALDAQRGTLLWKTQADEHPQMRIAAAQTLYHGQMYVPVAPATGAAGARGSLVALDIASGRILWRSEIVSQSAPTVDGDRGLLYVATEDARGGSAEAPHAAIAALELVDGRQRWLKPFPHEESRPAAAEGDAPSSPILRHSANEKHILLVTERCGTVAGLDPDHIAQLLWQTKLDPDATRVATDWGAAADHRRLYVATSGADTLTALDISSGAVRWRTAVPTPPCSWSGRPCLHAQSQAVTAMPGIAFSGSLDGHLRAYSTNDGKIVWDFDTAREYLTVNGVKGSGGSLDQGGVAVVNGIVYVNSGFGGESGQPGNVLLAFSVDGK